MLDYIKADDFQGTESLQGNETRARVVEALKITSHTLQANRSKEGTIVTVKDLINLPREVSGCGRSHCQPTTISWGCEHPCQSQRSFYETQSRSCLSETLYTQASM